MRFANSVINGFESKEHDPMILGYLFNDFASKPIILIDVPFCSENEKVSKEQLKKLKAFTKKNYDFRIVWKIKKIIQLFPLKKENPYPSCKIYEGVCFCKKNYIGETKRNVDKDSEPVKHLFQHPDHVFQWKVLMSAPMNYQKREKFGGILHSSETYNLK